MDPDDSDPFEGPVFIPEQDSESAYETSENDSELEVEQESHESDGIIDAPLEGENDSLPASFANQNPDNGYTDEAIRADAIRWAATFIPPRVEDIPIPARRETSRRSPKRKQVRPNGTWARAKRLKGFYSRDYRDLLNIEIHDSTKRSIHEDKIEVERSQIGSSVWTAKEKDDFFTGLSRIGKDNVKAIAARIGTKSEVEVQEYIRVLHQALLKKTMGDSRLLESEDFPAAAEITLECCSVMERASDALAVRQERYEEKIEKVKWGDYWLLTEDTSMLLEKEQKMSRGEEIMEEVLPAANLLNLKNWLALSQKIFMNPSESKKEDNWRELSENGEPPAIRATAFEDFHAITVNITKRLVSTVLFCTMSRMRATKSTRSKQAEVNANDVEAACNILRMDANSNEFWIKCARRNHLRVSNPDDDSRMTYDDIEFELRKQGEKQARSRSRPRTGSARKSEVNLPDTSHSSSDSSDFSDSLPLDIGSESEFLENDNDAFPFTQPSQSQPESHGPLSPTSYEIALESHISALDDRASALEEQRIWRLLRQVPPFDIKPDEDDLPEKPKGERGHTGEYHGDWRKREVWSEWEGRNGVVKEELFFENRKRMEKKRKRMERERRRSMGKELESETRDGEYVVESDDDDNENHGAEGDNSSEIEDMGAMIARDELQGDEESASYTPRRSYAIYNSDD